MRPSRDMPAAPAHGQGFTLVEVLVVITILGLLVGIIIPVGVRVRQNIRKSASYAALAVLDGACQMYFNDFSYYPASRYPEDSNPPGWYGSEWLVQALTGYVGNPGNNYTPGPDPRTDDGNPSFGFRTAARGKVYGPYNDAHKIKMMQINGRPPVFVDSFDNPILYYRFDGSQSQYQKDDNTNGPKNINGSNDINEYAKDGPAPNGKYYRNDYILITPGASKAYDKLPRDGGGITNFSR